MITKIIKKIELDDTLAQITRIRGGYSAVWGGRGHEGVNFWDYTITFEDDTVYKMTRIYPIESESNGLNVGDTVTFIIKGDRIQKVKLVEV
jgi:hypothetical protein